MMSMTSEIERSTDVALSMCSVSKTFTARPVLEDVSLTLARGEAACLYGVNGAGKSTLLRIAAGLLRPDTGSIRIEGWDAKEHPERFRRHLGLISHASMVYAELSVQENLVFVADLYGVSNRVERIEQLLAETDLGPFRHDRAGILSRGLLQRLAIARALLHEPALLLADEPFTGLDVEAVGRLIRVFAGFISGGGTLLMTTHDTRLGLRCSQRVVVLDRGRFLWNKTQAEIDPERFADDYLSYARGEN
jgi:heme exporter protein A